MDDISSKKILGLNFIAVIEIVAFILCVYLVSHFFFNGNRLIDVYPHPLWAILLWISLRYGATEALVCAILMILFLYFGNMPDQQFSQTIFEYYLSISFRPVLWVTSALILGGISGRKITEMEFLKMHLNRTEKKKKAIGDSYVKLQELNRQLLDQMEGEMGSALEIFETAKSLAVFDDTSRDEVIEQIIKKALNPEKFSLFIKEDKQLNCEFDYGWSDCDEYARTLNESNELYISIVKFKKIVCVMDEYDREVLGKHGVLAGPVKYPGTGEVFGMLKFEKIGLEMLSVRMLRVFGILCEWIGIAYENCDRLVRAKQTGLINYDNMLYTNTFLNDQTEFLSVLSKRLGFHFAKLVVKLINSKELLPEDQSKAAVYLGQTVKQKLRDIDLIFDEEHKGESFAILVSGTKENDIDKVLIKIEDQLLNGEGRVKNAKYSFSVYHYV